MKRREFLAAAATVAGGAAPGAMANTGYPSKPVTLVVAFAPGGGTDALARALAVPLSAALKQPVVVDNKPGGSATIGSDFVARSAPDGHTLLITSGPHVTNPSLMERMPYDTLKAFTPVSLAAESPFVLCVKPDSPIRSLDDLVRLARQQTLSYGSSGAGTSDHLLTEMLSRLAGIRMTHVPYKGTGPAVRDLVGGHLDLMFANIPGVAALVRADKLRAIAVTTAKRSSLLPNVPTVQDLIGKPFDVSAWTGLLAPAGTPGTIVGRIHAEVRQALQAPSVQEAMATAGAETVGSTPAQFKTFIETEIPKWADIIKAANIKV